MVTQRRVATMVDWTFAPEWLTLDEACFLSGRDRDTVLLMIDEGGVDTNVAGLIEKQRLYEFLEILVDVLHWNS